MNSKLILIGLLLILFSTQAHAGLTDDLVSYYKLDETSGATLADETGTYPITHSGTTLNQTGKIGKAITINATINSFNIGYLGTNSSINFWHKYNSGTINVGGVFEIPVTSNKYHQLLIDFDNSSNKYFFNSFSQCGGTGYSYTITDAINPSNYNMITVTWDSSSFYVYVNGVYNGTFTKGSDGSCNPLNYWEMGRHTNQNYDEIGIWNRTLTSNEITKLYGSGFGLAYPFSGNASFSYNINVEEEKIYLTDTTVLTDINVVDWNWLVDGLSISTDQNTSFIATEFTDYNVCLIINDGNFSTCETINSGRFFGRGFIKLYDSLNNELDQVSYVISPAINGVSSGVLTDNNLDLNFTAITSSNYTFTFSKSSYTTIAFTLPLTQYTNFDYNFIMLDVNKTSNVNFQVFNESGAYAKTKTFYAYDYSLNKYVGIQTTDTLGRLTFNLDQTKSDYNFFSTDFNFGTTIWNINKPKDIVTLSDINGTWEYSITGPSYSNASNIAAGIQKLLLQNTVYPYLIKIVDTDKSYASTTFGLKSVTSEKEKTLTLYLYKYADADLKLIKLIDFATNQPHSSSEELTLSLYTDTNGLIPIGIFVNDSTGTYNIYMDENATYELQVLSQSYNLRPTLDIYYLYLTEDIGLIIDNNLIVDVNAPIMDANLPIIFTQLREAVFGCSSTTDNCYPSMIFSLIAVALLLIVLAISGQIGAISQSITIGILLTMFLIIGFIPLWLYGVGVVILIAWGVFGQ